MRELSFNNLETLGHVTREAFNVLKTNLSFCSENAKTIMITSCSENEGKSSTAISLCRVIAADGKRVLYLDADMRKSSLKTKLDLKSGVIAEGLSDYLCGELALDEVVYCTNVNNLFVLPAGLELPNPSGLLESDKFASAIEYGKENFDIVIIDTPALGIVIDAAVIAKRCDGTILLIEAGHISYKIAKEVKKQVEMADCKVLGAVINKAYYDKKTKLSRKFGQR